MLVLSAHGQAGHPAHPAVALDDLENTATRYANSARDFVQAVTSVVELAHSGVPCRTDVLRQLAQRVKQLRRRGSNTLWLAQTGQLKQSLMQRF
jgi:hypothetical protein